MSAVAGWVPGSASAAAPATSAATGPAPYPTEPFVAAQSARAFGDSVGVNVHLIWADSSYGNFETILARMKELGVRYIRDGICPGCTTQLGYLRRLADNGIKAHIIAGDLQGWLPKMYENLAAIRNQVRSAVVSVEAPNEPDITGDPDWINKTRIFQKALWQAVKGDPALAGLPVLGPAVVSHPARAELGDLSAYLDRGNMHPYPGGGTPYHTLDDERRLAAYISGSKKLVATEAGYHSDLVTTSGHPPASERASGFYMPRLALEGFRGGVERTYVYQLADLFSQAGKPAWFSNLENSFGLLRWDMSRKPSFLALRNLLTAAGGASAPVAAPGGLKFGLEGAGADVRQLLLRSADGSYSLVLWRDVSVWDRDARRDLYPAADQLDVVLGQPLLLARRFDPVDSETEKARWVDPRRISVEVGGGPVVLRLTPPCIVIPSGGSGAASGAAAKPIGNTAGPASSSAAVGADPVGALASKSSVKLRLSGTRRRPRLARTFSIKVACAAPCATVHATGMLALTRGKHRRRFRIKSARGAAKKGVVTLRLKIPARARRAARKALRRRGRASAHVTIIARTASGAKLERMRRKVLFRRR